MKRSLRVVGVLAALSLCVMSAPTTAANGDFTLTVNLTPACKFATNALVLNYTSFQETATNVTAPLTATCTTGQLYSLSLAGAGMTLGGDSITYSGTAVGLNYTLRIQTGAGADVSTAALQAGTGATVQNYQIRGVIAANQEGSCTADTGNLTGDPVCATVAEIKTIVASF
jgi:opacity protein-like surface antigen